MCCPAEPSAFSLITGGSGSSSTMRTEGLTSWWSTSPLPSALSCEYFCTCTLRTHAHTAGAQTKELGWSVEPAAELTCCFLLCLIKKNAACASENVQSVPLHSDVCMRGCTLSKLNAFGQTLGAVPRLSGTEPLLSLIMQLDDSSCDNPWLSPMLPC